jgi:hypothetical protein
MLVMVMVLLSVLVAVPLMLDGDIANKQQVSQADLIAQTLTLQYNAALSLCPASGVALPAACTDATQYIDTGPALDPAVANGPLAQGPSPLIISHYDAGAHRIVAFVNEANNSRVAHDALWGQVSAVVIATSVGASGVGFWQPVLPGATQGFVMGQNGSSGYTIDQRQGPSYQLRPGNPLMVQPTAGP